LNFGFCLSLATSADGTLSITSTSPASRAAAAPVVGQDAEDRAVPFGLWPQ
jgi:hypothetical protein